MPHAGLEKKRKERAMDDLVTFSDLGGSHGEARLEVNVAETTGTIGECRNGGWARIRVRRQERAAWVSGYMGTQLWIVLKARLGSLSSSLSLSLFLRLPYFLEENNFNISTEV